MQDTLFVDQNISLTSLKAEMLELRVACKTLIAKNEELIAKLRSSFAKNEEYAGIILALREQVQLLKDEIAVLKGQKPRPKIPPNRLNEKTLDPRVKVMKGNGQDRTRKIRRVILKSLKLVT
jgi:hypothetical protein